MAFLKGFLMYNDLFSIGPVTVHTYGVMIAIGIICAYFIAAHRAKKCAMPQRKIDEIFGLAVMMILFGFLFSKLLYLLTIIPYLADGSMTLSGAITGGWVIYGGLFGGVIGGILYSKWRKVDFWEYMDIAVPAVAFAQGCGRIGCFFAGCCYGEETTSSWFYLEFTNSAFAPNHVHLIPTQLIMSAGDFLLFFLLLWYEKKVQKREGELLGMYLTVYSIGRFLVEFLRGDAIRGQIGILSTSQFIGIFAAAAGFIILIRQRKCGLAVEELAARNAEESAQEAADKGADAADTTADAADAADTTADAAADTTADAAADTTADAADATADAADTTADAEDTTADVAEGTTADAEDKTTDTEVHTADMPGSVEETADAPEREAETAESAKREEKTAVDAAHTGKGEENE